MSSFRCAAQCSAGGWLLLRYHRPIVKAGVFAVLLFGLSGTARAQDPASLAPTLYEVELDNAWVRVLRLRLGPHQATPRHRDLPHVIVWVTRSRERVTNADGPVTEDTHEPGQVAYNPGLAETRENLSAQPIEEIVIELKPNAQRSEPVTLDPVTLDPEHHIVVLENPRVRALRTILEPGLKSPLHEHPHYVVVYITELHTTMELGDGRVVDNPRRPGDVAWRDFMKHSTLNIGKQTAVEIQVELK
jgi:quercetin dioxygenase-like cupin family protein